MSTDASATAPLATVDCGGPLRPTAVVAQVALIQEVMSAVMKDGEHFGKIPGCGTKPALLQPGAQVLALTFRLAPCFDIDVKELPNLHREYVVSCTLTTIGNGQVIGMGVGSCSTMESKYRYRNVADFELTGEEIPKDSKERKAEYRRQGLGMKKVNDVWEWVRFTDTAKTENPDIADTYNTVLKMASKRAFVHAVLNATAASDMFTQDIEDLPAAPTNATEPESAPQPKPIKSALLKAIRAARKALDVSDDTYAAQLEYYGVSVDSELTEQAGVLLLAAYDRRKTDLEAAAKPEAGDKS